MRAGGEVVHAAPLSMGRTGTVKLKGQDLVLDGKDAYPRFRQHGRRTRRASTEIHPHPVTKMVMGVGDRNNPKPGGTGKIYIDDIRLTKRMP